MPHTLVLAPLYQLPFGKGKAYLTTIASDGVLAENDEHNPDRVIAVTHSERFTTKHPYTFPSASVTAIEIPLKK